MSHLHPVSGKSPNGKPGDNPHIFLVKEILEKLNLKRWIKMGSSLYF